MLYIIDRYIAKLFLGYFVAGLVVFVTIFLAVDFMASMVSYDVGNDVLIRYYGYMLPSIVYQMIPVGCLLGAVFTVSSLQKSNELTALFSVGMSYLRVSAAILVLVSAISFLAFWLGDRVLPGFAQKKNYIYFVDMKKRPGLYSTVKNEMIWYRSDNVLFNIRMLDPTLAKAFELTLYYFDSEWNLSQVIRAAEVSLRKEIWELKDGTVTLFPTESSFPLSKPFDTKIITMSEDVADIQTESHSAEVLSLSELDRFIRKNKEAGLDTLNFQVDYHGKFSFAMAALVMTMMGLPFGVSRQRSGGSFLNIGLCVAFAFIYWLLFTSSITLGKSGHVPPFLAAWGPNVLILCASVYFFYRLKK